MLQQHNLHELRSLPPPPLAAALTYVMVWMATDVGRVCGIPDSIMGLTAIAAGASSVCMLSR
jgi:hypothetical protein